MITLTPWAAAALAFALLSAGGTAGFLTAAILTAGSRADHAADIARAFRKGLEAGRAAARTEMEP